MVEKKEVCLESDEAPELPLRCDQRGIECDDHVGVESRLILTDSGERGQSDTSSVSDSKLILRIIHSA